jgi:chromosome segregation ATPase
VTKLKQLLTSFTAIILITSIASVFSFAEPETQSPEVADALFALLESAKNEVDALFDGLSQEGGTIPEVAQESYDEAMALWGGAQTHYDEEEYDIAEEKATEALNEFGEAAEEISEIEDDEDEEDEVDEETETAIELGVHLERAEDRLDKLWEIVQSLEDEGFEVNEVFGILEMAETRHGEAMEQFNIGDFEASEESLSIVMKMLGQATGFIHSTSNQIKKGKAEKFITKTMVRLVNLQNRVIKLLESKGVSQEDLDLINGLFGEIIDQLETLDLDLDEENLEDIVDELDDLVEDVDDIIEDEDDIDDDTAEILEDIEEIEYKLSEYDERVTELENTGKDVTILRELIEEAITLLSQTELDLENSEFELSEEKIEEIEEILDLLEDQIEDIENELEEEEEETELNDVEEEAELYDEDEVEEEFSSEKAELEETFLNINQIIQELIYDGEDVSELESIVEEIESMFEEAEDIEDLEDIEDHLEELETILKEQYDVKISEEHSDEEESSD